MLDKRILREWFCEHIRHHVFSGAWEELDQPLPGMVTEMVPCHIDVLCPWTELGKSGQLQSPGIVFKRLAKHMGFGAQDLEPMGGHLDN